MGSAIPPKVIAEKAMESFASEVEKNGFVLYKGKKFLRVMNDVIHLIELFPGKNDFYIWYSCYPLAQKDISFGSGVIADRFPDDSCKLKITDEASLSLAIDTVMSSLSGIMQFLGERSSVADIGSRIDDSSNLYSLFTKGVCLFYQGKYASAASYIEQFVNSGLRGIDVDNAKELLDAIEQQNDLKELASKYIADNVKKLRLSKFM